MNAASLGAIDWGRPWLTGLRPIANRILAADDWRAALNAAAVEAGLRNHAGLPVHFVPQTQLPPDVPYEAFIGATGAVPTRDNLHDFFNALVWLSFPKTKARLNALQAKAIADAARDAETGGVGKRGRLRDAATIFDENAALWLVCDPALTETLRAHRWDELFVLNGHAFGRTCEISLFGHALMEKLVTPYKAITAHAWPIAVSPDFFTLSLQHRMVRIDTILSEQLSAGLATTDFMPLPVLGVPGWWQPQDAAFYADAKVFRPPRRAHRRTEEMKAPEA